MFTNIGDKIKSLAKVIAWIGIAGSVISGFVMINSGYGVSIIMGIGVILGGSLISWISSWFLYGFGELIEKTTEIAWNTAKGATISSQVLRPALKDR